jgi:hypothetical protein
MLVGLPIAERVGTHTSHLPVGTEGPDYPGADQGEQVALVGVIAHPLEVGDMDRLLPFA